LTLGTATRRLGRRLAQVPPALLVVVSAALLLRIALSLAYSPTYATSFDTNLYLDVAGGELFSDPTRPIGYPLFLRALHTLSDSVAFTIQVQHLLGIACGLLLYATVRRLGAPVWAAVVAAAAVLLPLDQIFLEHILMAEAPFELALFAALYCAVRGLDPSRPTRLRIGSRALWIAGAASLLALAAWLRTTGLPLIPLFALWFAFALDGPLTRRLARGAVCIAAAAAVLLAYMALHASYTGNFGMGNGSGWALYARVAPFADCSRFDPPAGTEALCEMTPPDARPGPDFYAWQPGSPAIQMFTGDDFDAGSAPLGAHDEGDEQLGAFAREALIHQPLSYANVVARDFVRYFEPSFQPQDFSGYGYDELDVELRLPAEPIVVAAINSYYGDVAIEVDDGIEPLGELQDVVRIHPKLLALAILLAVGGLILGRGRARAGVALLLGTSLVLLLVPPATAIWSSRYAVPVSGPLVASAAIGTWLALGAISGRLRARRLPSAP
jgi:hypothetical protein